MGGVVMSGDQRRRQPAPGEVTSRWRSVEWGEHEERRLADLLFGRSLNSRKHRGSCKGTPVE